MPSQFQSAIFQNAIAVAPHAAAAEAAVHILREGGNAIEAMVAAAATIAVVYPHMTAIGGDAFWLIHQPGKAPIATICAFEPVEARSMGTKAELG